jgi:two-component system LytT family response regulator
MSSNYSCIIVDDEQAAINLLSVRLNKIYKNIQIKGSCLHWEDALDLLRTNSYDILFLDISLPGKNSIELLKLLPALDCEIVFVTAHEEHAIEAFNFSTSGYILKPFTDAELAKAVNKAIQRVATKRLALNIENTPPVINDKIGIPNNYGIDYVKIEDIIYMESITKCTRIVTTKGEYISSNNLGTFKKLVDDRSFFAVHRSFIINLNWVLRYNTSGVVIMSNKKEIPVARSVRIDFLKCLGNNI